MKVEIKNRFTRSIILAGEYTDIRTAVLAAKKSNADLSCADLSCADLSGVNLSGVNLRYADLRSADLRCVNLRSADLSAADLRCVNLRSADLSAADLSGAELRDADLRGANNISPLLNAQTSIIPVEGQFIGWKKCRDSVIVKLMIGKNAKRSNSTSRKCRAEYVKVLGVFGAEVGISQHDSKIEYRTGKIIRCDKWNEDRWVECGGGIHFFITRVEAENY